jgi:hypothetical protein
MVVGMQIEKLENDVILHLIFLQSERLVVLIYVQLSLNYPYVRFEI